MEIQETEEMGGLCAGMLVLGDDNRDGGSMGVVGSLGEERLRAWKGDSVWLKVNSGDPRLCFGQRVEKRR